MRIGSVSKLFVATAVMQLVEQGKLDLDTDVNRYLTALQLEDFCKDVNTTPDAVAESFDWDAYANYSALEDEEYLSAKEEEDASE